MDTSLIVLVAIGIIVAAVAGFLLLRGKGSTTVVKEARGGMSTIEKCGHCGFVLSGQVECTGLITSSNGSFSVKQKEDGREVCPHCKRQLKR